nr:DUF6884 domain-containing protein [Nocardia altamirensis]
MTRLALRAAHQITTPERVRILSGRHGLLDPATEIAPYNQRIDAPGAITVDQLRDQARQLALPERTPVIVLAGNTYAHIARQIWADAITPLTGTRGLGEQYQRLNQIATSTATTTTIAAASTAAATDTDRGRAR